VSGGARAAVAAGASALLLAAAGAPANPSAAGGSGLFDVRSAEVPGSGSFAVQVSGAGYRCDETGAGSRKVDVADGGLQVAAGVGAWGEVWGHVGAAVLSVGAEDYRAISVRDGRVGAKVRLGGGRVVPGLAAEASLPWGVRARGFSTGAFEPGVTGLLTLHLPESNTLTGATLHANVGWRRLGDDRGRGFEGWPLYFLEPVHPAATRDRMDLRLALELAGRRTTLFAELLLDQLPSESLAFRESPMFLTPGFRWYFTESLSLMAASKITLASDDESSTRYKAPEDVYPNWQIGFALAWLRRGPGADRDGDGIPDFRDQCPREAEDKDGWDDADGCPERDNDSDGIPDEFDAAPDQREDFDGWIDSDGAADPDNDGDGILDEADACPLDAEDRDGVADADGCPEKDADGDGLPDESDKCPEQAENVDGVEDGDGCPERLSGAPQWLPGVVWDGAAVAPQPAAYYELNRLAERMQRDPGLNVQIRVLTEAPRDARAGKPDLATLRAEYLKAFLVTTGIDPARVEATGLAAATPTGAAGAPLPRAEVVTREAIRGE
jgi:hypothetical protein